MSDQADEDQKTEEPTQKKIDDAIKKGDVAKSQEFGNLFVLAGGTAVIGILAGPMSAKLFHALGGMLGNIDQIATDQHGLMQFFMQASTIFLIAIALPFFFLFLAGIVGNLVQHRFVFSSESLIPKISKINPVAGFKRIFGKDAIVNLIKGVLKIGLVALVLTMVMWPQRGHLDGLMRTDVFLMLPASQTLVMKVMTTALMMIGVIAGADYLYQYRKWHHKLMMTKEEMKEEYKQAEGNPEIKAKIKQLQRERASKRMMSEVPKATVVVTNPTHFAVALKYDDDMAAPKCVAKGADAVAMRIRELATESGVPLVENPPLARTLFATVDIDDEVPEENYKAVAEVITYVLRLKRGERVGAFRPTT